MTPEFLENGLGARLLLAYPPRRQKRWTEEDLVGEIEQRVNEVFTNLLELQPSRDSDGDPEPVDVPLSSDAKALWVAFVNESGREQAGRDGEGLVAAWSKLEGYAARFALLVHQLRHAADPKSVDPWRVDAGSVSAGIELARWFGNEAERVYAVLSESDEERALRLLCENIAIKGRDHDAARSHEVQQALPDRRFSRVGVAGHRGRGARPLGRAGVERATGAALRLVRAIRNLRRR